MPMTKDGIQEALKVYNRAVVDVLELEAWSTWSSLTEIISISFAEEDGGESRAILKASPMDMLEAQEKAAETLLSTSSMSVPRVLARIKAPETDPVTLSVPRSYIVLESPTGTPFSTLEAPEQANHLPGDVSGVATAYRQLGAALKEVHGNVFNEWYGPIDATPDSGFHQCLSWQECFTLLLETAFDDVLSHLQSTPASVSADGHGNEGLQLDAKWLRSAIQDLRLALGRAIAFYVFEDVEVPSLTLCPSFDWASRFFASASPSNTEGADITFIGLDTAIWGDPLMEGALLQYPSPSTALVEGYGGVESLVQFPRQETKRLWYVAFAATQELLASLRDTSGDKGGSKDGQRQAKAKARGKKAEKILKVIVEKLRDAPCY